MRLARDARLPLVSVVIPTYNRAATILRAVNSVLRQSYPHLELLIVDDGSTDSTADVVSTVTDPRVRYIPLDRNRGVSVARNRGIEEAVGDYVAFQDSDDEWLPERLERQLQVFAQYPETGFVFCKLVRVLQNPAGLGVVPGSSLPGDKDQFLRKLLKSNFIWTQTWLVKAEFIKQLRFHENIRRVQDWDLALTIASQCEVRYVDEPLVIAYFSEGSLLSLTQQRALDLQIMLETQGKLLSRFPEIAAEYYRSIAVALREGGEGNYRLICRWAYQALRSRPLDIRFWQTLLISIAGAPGKGALRFCRSLRRIAR